MMDDPLEITPQSMYRIRRRRSRTLLYQRVVASLALLFLAQSTNAQQIGVDVCACQPSVYEFTFDFELACDDQNVGGAGITDTTCLTELRGEQNQDDADLVPVAVGQVSIFELDQNLDVIAQTVNTGLFLSGSTFTYTSIIATEPDLLNPDSLPRGIQLVFIGVNALNQAIVNTFAILYNNDCGVFPLLRVGQQAGWIIFTDLGNPPEEVCPIAAAPSSSPSFATTRPSVLPGAPTFSPSAPFAPIAPIVPTVPSSPPLPPPSSTAAPTIKCPPGKRKGTSQVGKGKGKGYYQKKIKESSGKRNGNGHSKIIMDSGKGKGKGSSTKSSGGSNDAGKGKGSSTKSSGGSNGKGASTKSSKGTYGKGKGASTKSSKGTSGKRKGKGASTKSSTDSYGKGKGKGSSTDGTYGDGKRVQQKHKNTNYGSMSRVGKRSHLRERLLGIGRVSYQNKSTGASGGIKRPSPFEPISDDYDEHDSLDDLDDDDDTSGDYDDDEYPECIEPNYPISGKGKGKGKGSSTKTSKSHGKGSSSSTKSSSGKGKGISGKGSSTKSSNGKGASGKGSSTKYSSSNGKGASGKGSSTKYSSGKGKGSSTKSSKGKGKGSSKDSSDDTHSSGKGKRQEKGTSSSRGKGKGYHKQQRPHYKNEKTMTKLQKGKRRFRDLMEQEYQSYQGF